MCMYDRFWIDVWSILGPFWGGKSVQNRFKNDVEKQCEKSSDQNSQRIANQRLQRPAAPSVSDRGEGVGGEVNLSQRD